MAREAFPEVGRRTEAGLGSDLVHGEVGLFEKSPGVLDADCGEPLVRCASELVAKAAVQACWTHRCPRGDVWDGDGLARVLLGPEQGRCKRTLLLLGDGALDELTLSARAMSWEHQTASDRGAGLRAVVAAYDVERQVQGGGAAS